MPSGIYIRTKRHKENMSKTRLGEKNYKWKGNKAKPFSIYCRIHREIVKKLGKPKVCWICKTTKAKKYEWANKDHKYSAKIED